MSDSKHTRIVIVGAIDRHLHGSVAALKAALASTDLPVCSTSLQDMKRALGAGFECSQLDLEKVELRVLSAVNDLDLEAIRALDPFEATTDDDPLVERKMHSRYGVSGKRRRGGKRKRKW